MLVRRATTSVARLLERPMDWKMAAMTSARCTKQNSVMMIAAKPTVCPYIVAAFAASVVAATEMTKPVSKRRAVLAQTTPKSALSHMQVMDLTNILLERVSIPGLPTSIQAKVLSEVVQHVSDELPNHLDAKQLRQIQRNIDFAGKACNLSAEERKKLVVDISTSINVPLMPASMREKVASMVIDILLGDFSFASLPAPGISAGSDSDAGSLLDEKGRKNLAHRMADKIPALPMVPKEQEEAILAKVIDAIGKPLEDAVPEQMRHSLHGASAADIEKFKQQTVDDLEAKLPGIPLLSKEKETEILRAAVDALFECFLNHSGLDGVVLSPELQLERMKQAEQSALETLELTKRKNKRAEAAALRQIANIREQKAQLQKEVNKLHPHYLAKAAILSTVLGVAAYFAGVCK